MADEFDIVAVELEREIYNRDQQPEKSGCGGCLIRLIGGLFILLAISEILRFCSIISR